MDDLGSTNADAVDFLGFSIYAGSPGRALLELRDRVAEGRTTHVVTLNSEMALVARRHPEFAEVVRKAEMRVADGIGIVLGIRFLTGRKVHRITGISLADDLMAAAAREGFSVFFLGARSGVIERAVEHIRARFPHLRIVGWHHGYFHGQEEEVVAEIQASEAQVLLVGTGSPGQEFFIARTRERLPCKLLMGIGGAFEVWAGRRHRAAPWIQRMGLEWLYRAFVDPSRWRRLSFIPRFAWLVLREKFSRQGTV
ncbi:MAG: hypothetical protein B1H03_02870 [Planctomycetales bacterium 4484_113]|nr:MAG: hypothetical protein B1H03_02870 [Planctomycetales bacterium 4484_113]